MHRVKTPGRLKVFRAEPFFVFFIYQLKGRDKLSFGLNKFLYKMSFFVTEKENTLLN